VLGEEGSQIRCRSQLHEKKRTKLEVASTCGSNTIQKVGHHRGHFRSKEDF